jgi:aryl-alcohol dehydrogenase-like predicted oxidoreductase
MSQPRPLFNRLSQDAPRIPRLGLGLMGMSLMYGPTTSDSERFAVLDRALDLGANHWDSAEYVFLSLYAFRQKHTDIR